MKHFMVITISAVTLAAVIIVGTYVVRDEMEFRQRMACDDAIFYYNIASENPESANVEKYQKLAQEAALACIPKECLADVKECTE